MEQKSDNRKAMPKFILTMVGALVLGGVLGVAIIFADGLWTVQLGSALRNGLLMGAPYLIFGAVLLNGVTALTLYRKAKRLYSAMTEEDDAVSARIDRCLNYAMLVNNVCTILSYFFIAVPFVNIQQIRPFYLLICVAAFLSAMAEMLVVQQKVIDLLKTINPEKRGSVYDLKFQKKWYDSCDEMERAVIGQAAYASYKATNAVCLVLWLLLVFGNMLFDFGILPIAMVSTIWLVSTLSYCLKAMALEKKG